MTRQARLPAGLLQKLFPVQPILGSDLWKEQSSIPAGNNEQTVPAYLDFLRTYGNKRRQDRDFNFQFVQFFLPEARKSLILNRRARRRMDNAFPQWFMPFDNSNATSKPSSDMQRHKYAFAFRKNPLFWDSFGKTRVHDRLDNGEPRQRQERLTLLGIEGFFRTRRHPRASFGLP